MRPPDEGLEWKHLRRFLFNFSEEDGRRLPVYCGVTATDEDSALLMISNAWNGGVRPTYRSVVIDVDVSEAVELLSRFVRPLNMGVPVRPGIWYPNLNG